MCDPTISTCLPDTTTEIPTGICSADELGPVCYEEELPVGAPVCSIDGDAYTSDGLPVLESVDPAQGVISYFQENDPVTIPHDEDLLLSEYAAMLPIALLPYVRSLMTMQTENPQTSVSLRVTNVEGPGGATHQRFFFFRTGSNNTPPTGGRAPTTNGVMVGTIGTVAAIVAFDEILLDGLIENDLMPEEARMPVLFTSVLTAHAAMYRAGLVDVSVAEGLQSVPAFLGYQMIVLSLMHAVGIDTQDPLARGGAMVLGSFPFIWARIALTNQALTAIEEVVMAERGLATRAAAQRWMATEAGEVYVAEQLSARGVTRAALAEAGGAHGLRGITGLGWRAASFRVGSFLARGLGNFLIVTLGADAGLGVIGWANSHLSSGDTQDNRRLWRLVRTCTSQVDQDRWGGFMGSVLGPLATFAAVTRTWHDEDFDTWYEGQIEQCQDDLAEASDQFGHFMHHALIAAIAENLSTPDGADLQGWHRSLQEARSGSPEEFRGSFRDAMASVNDTTWTVDWAGVRHDIEDLYQGDEDRADNIENAYEAIDDMTAPLTISGIDRLIEIVDDEGEIQDQGDLETRLVMYARLERFHAMQQLRERSIELGLVQTIGGVEVNLLTDPNFRPNAEQEQFLASEALDLTMQISYYGLFMQGMGEPR